MGYNISNTPAEDLQLYARSRHGLIVIETHEERRVIRMIKDAAHLCNREMYRWSRIDGLERLRKHKQDDSIDSSEYELDHWEPPEKSTDAIRSLLYLGSLTTPWMAVFTDLHSFLSDHDVCRALRQTASIAGRRNTGTICLVSPILDIPTELECIALHFPFPLPNIEQFETIIKTVYTKLKRTNPNITAELAREELNHITEAMLGLTEEEAVRAAHRVILRDNRLDVHDLTEIQSIKRSAVATRGQLEVIPVTGDLSTIGGLDNLKDWLHQRANAFTERAIDFGLSPPKGILLLGVQGCGKSLCARVTAGEWRRPLLRLDMGSLYNKFIGTTEANLRESLRQAEAMAPCVLWIDEIEKAFASSGSGSADGGLSQRLFATMLTWLNDRTSDVFIAATANSVKQLPPELLRKGRFDEIFFVDLPPAEARRKIFEIHLMKRKRDPAEFDLDALITESAQFSGAEIEQAIVGALYTAFNSESELATEHILRELEITSPIAVIMAEKVAQLRAWAAQRCVPAHHSEEAQ